ncbi:hypothetical protein [Streptomyces sp. LN245]|uniref:hypothetical protein n=1 Tax=Streptomyces sp. LN245 TaxID=3112975 RepID=UPI0037229A9E
MAHDDGRERHGHRVGVVAEEQVNGDLGGGLVVDEPGGPVTAAALGRRAGPLTAAVVVGRRVGPGFPRRCSLGLRGV